MQTPEFGNPFQVLGIEAVADPGDIEAFSVLVTDSAGAPVVEIPDVQPGQTCGVDFTFPPGDYDLVTSDGNGGRFTSVAATGG